MISPAALPASQNRAYAAINRGASGTDPSSIGSFDLVADRMRQRHLGDLPWKIGPDGNGNPIALKLSAGQAHDGRSAADMLGDLGPGQILLADRAYDSDALRERLSKRGAWANVKPMPNRVDIPAFRPFLYRYRNLVERFFNKLKNFRAIATRFEKQDADYLAVIKLAAARIWMRSMSR
jgi:transposase